MKIIAHFMHEMEEAAAKARMTDYEVTDSYLVGEIKADEIPALQQAGVIIEPLAEEPALKAPVREEVAPGLEIRRTRGMRPMLDRGEMAAPPPRREVEAAVDLGGPNFYLVQLSGPLLEEWRQKLKGVGVELLEYLPPHSYTSRLKPEQVTAVQQFPFIGMVRLYDGQDTLQQPATLRGLPPSAVQRMQDLRHASASA